MNAFSVQCGCARPAPRHSLIDFGANATLRFDPKTEQFTVHKSTSRNASVRQILGRPGVLWLPESGADKLVVIRE